MLDVSVFGSEGVDTKVLVLLPEEVFNPLFILQKIIQPLGLPMSKYLAFYPVTTTKKKLSKKEFDVLSADVLEYCDIQGVRTVVTVGADLFKFFSKETKSTFTTKLGSVQKGIDEYSSLVFIPLLNPVVTNKYPSKIGEVNKGLNTIAAVLSDVWEEDDSVVKSTKSVIVGERADDIITVLKRLAKAPALFVDIETTGLEWYKDRMLTISFSPNGKDAWCFPIHEIYRGRLSRERVLMYLRQFFNTYVGKLVFHNGSFDVPFIVHECMRNSDFSIDHVPLVDKLNLRDTMIMAYIKSNSTERAKLGLKYLSFPIMGAYDEEVDVANLIDEDLQKVALYNNLDVVATAQIFKMFKEKFTPTDNILYWEMMDISKTLISVKMQGLRVDNHKAKILYTKYAKELVEMQDVIKDLPSIKQAELVLAEQAMIKKNKTLKTKQHTDVSQFLTPFNFGSGQHKALLFFDILNLPVLSVSKKSKLPQTGTEIIEDLLKLSHLTKEQKLVLETIVNFNTLVKVNNTYIRVLAEDAIQVAKDDYRIFANFNQTTTVSGRLSSSGMVNFQNIPSGSKYAGEVKKLFIPPAGFIFAGSDYAALEDKVIAIQSNDKLKLSIFQKGIDGHCLNACVYFKDQMEAEGFDVDLENVEVINSVKKKFPKLRQDGKSCTFGLSYGAGSGNISKQLGISKKKATTIYNNYWKAYTGVAKHNKDVINFARKHGYVISECMGLKLLTPNIKSSDDLVRSKEERVAVNFSTQSFGWLTLRAMANFQKQIIQEGKSNDIKIVNTIHDAIYCYIRDKPEVIEYVNRNLIKHMCKDFKPNQQIPLTAELDIGYNWKDMITLPNDITAIELETDLNKLKRK